MTIFAAGASAAGGQNRYAKLDAELNHRAGTAPASETTSVIARFKANELPRELKQYVRSRLPNQDRYVLDVPNSKLKAIGSDARTISATHNGTVQASNFRTGIQSGAFFARHMMGINGAGIGIAVLDSGLAPNAELNAYFQDFLTPDDKHKATDLPCLNPCDTNGHGTHVAGTIAGNGSQSDGEQSGMAPGASLFVLRVLGADGTGTLAGVLDALDWVKQNHAAYNIRVVNLSFGMVPRGSLPDEHPLATMLANDLLAIKTKELVDAGVFVVAAAGNVGQVDCAQLDHPNHRDNKTKKCDVWGGITAPGTYPWVFTAGANSSQGSFTRSDDIRAKFSSRGPAFPLQNAKPDILAGGVGIESTSAPGSTLYHKAEQPIPGHPNGFLLDGGSYMALTGTSQAAAVVSGVAAQIVQANPNLTPNQIKYVLEYTAQEYQGYSPLEQGTGFLNALGAVQLAQFYVNPLPGQRVPISPIWSQHFIWGNHLMSGGLMLPDANAWKLGVMWGVAKTADGDNIVWGTSCGSDDCGGNIVWGTAADGDNIVWGTAADGDNIVWGTDCGGADCDNIVWGTTDGDNIVWGTAADGDNIVWGTAADGDNIVWGTAADGDNIVWGTAADGDNIVWGTGSLGRLPSTQMEWYQLFLNPRFDTWWVAHEFGEMFESKDGHKTEKPARKLRLRKRPESHKH